MTDATPLAGRMLRVREVCERGGFGRSTFYELANQGAFTLRKLGKRMSGVSEADYLAWANSRPIVQSSKGE
jgi:predicted DNA-binding transcriptional regulator AlpA